MIKKFLLVFTVLFSAKACAMNLPTEFTMTERWLSWTTTFDIESRQQKFGTVNRKLLSWTPQYHLKDLDDRLLAIGKMRFWNLLAFFDVFEADGAPLGTVEQRLTWFFPTFDIVSPQGLKLARASLNFWGTKYTLTSIVDEEHVLATMTRPFFRLKNNWTVNIIDAEAMNESSVHPHLLLVMLAYQVDREYWDAARRRRQNEMQNFDDAFGAAEARPFTALCASTTAQEGASMMPVRPAAAAELGAKLETFIAVLEESEPTEGDFTFVESLVTENITEEEAVLNKAEELFALFESDDLTSGQKAALYLLLKNRLEQ